MARRGDLSGWLSTGQSISGGSAMRTGRSTSSIIGSGPPCYAATASADRAHAARDPTRMPAIHNSCDWIEAATVTRPPPPLHSAATGHTQSRSPRPRVRGEDQAAQCPSCRDVAGSPATTDSVPQPEACLLSSSLAASALFDLGLVQAVPALSTMWRGGCQGVGLVATGLVGGAG